MSSQLIQPGDVFQEPTGLIVLALSKFDGMPGYGELNEWWTCVVICDLANGGGTIIPAGYVSEYPLAYPDGGWVKLAP